jgi:hypothetical protein
MGKLPMRFSIPLLAVSIFVSHGRADFHDDALAKHETTCALISNIKFHFKYSNGQSVYEGDCWINGERIDLKAKKNSNESFQCTIQPAEIRSVSRILNTRLRKIEPTASRYAPGRLLPEVMPWFESLIIFPSHSSTGTRTLQSLVTERYQKFQNESGMPVATSTNGESRIVLDPKHGNLVKSHITTSNRNGQKEVYSTVIDGFHLVAAGVYFPKRCLNTASFDGEVKSEIITEITSVELNSSAPPPLEFFEKTKVLDLINNTEYTVSANGEKSDLKPFEPAVSISNPTGTSTAPTFEEPTRQGLWLIPAGLSLATAGMALWWYRRRTNSVEE